MSNTNRFELAPLANTAETTSFLDDGANTNENMEGIDDGLISTPNPRRPSTGNGYPTNIPNKPIPEPQPPENIPYNPIPKPGGRRPLDVNLYATKKTVAQGMMDLALLTANSNQLRYVLESGNKNSPYYYLSITLISLSIILQLAIGVGLIFLGRFNVTRSSHAARADRLNNWVVLGVFFITAVNVFISAFGIDPVENMDPALIVDATLRSMNIRHGPEELPVADNGDP